MKKDASGRLSNVKINVEQKSFEDFQEEGDFLLIQNFCTSKHERFSNLIKIVIEG